MDVSQDKSNDHSEQVASKIAADKLSILVVSGLSGSGKTSVLNILEDLGYYSIDNLPLSLLANATYKLVKESGIRRIALGVDIRTPRADLSNFAETFESLKTTYGAQAVKVVYVTAQENALVARFSATRRVHPLMSQDANNDHAKHVAFNLPAAIKKEIELLEPVANLADIGIDTSNLNIHQLKDSLREYIGVDNQIVVNLLSFGFKYGSPIDADFVFDVRILPNPHWSPELRTSTGLDAKVAAFFADCPEVAEMIDDIDRFLMRWLPEFLHNNRHTVTVAIGCTGGKHRSVFITDNLQRRLANTMPQGIKVLAKHREKTRW